MNASDFDSDYNMSDNEMSQLGHNSDLQDDDGEPEPPLVEIQMPECVSSASAWA